ncbi:MAG TPA: D-alanyl-D-alanine carboxypeptidase [Firmicutes bacterium]|jgi:D-alanyl-D-alanine carboxypeptidase (penicillin-binding protein 5/6)|nr:D-alanyl-D-alanine carboxypeptidase [Bacillota bacterium]
MRQIRCKSWLLAAVIIICMGAVGSAAELDLTAKAALLMDADSGQIFYELNIDEPLPVASISKLMTLVLVLEALNDGKVALADLVTTSEYAASMGGSQVWLEPGEQLTLEEMLYAIAVGSANDAAVAAAEYLAGSESAFASLMNQRARELGLIHSEYSNASGLPPTLLGLGGRQVMSARDVAELARHALTVPRLLEFVSTYEYTMRSNSTKKPVLWNNNKLLRRYQGVDGLKTGFTTEAGYCIAATAKRDELRLIAVVLGSSSEASRESDITKLLDYGFREYTTHLVIPKQTAVGEIMIPKGIPEKVNVVVSRDFYVTVKRGEQAQITTEVSIDDSLPVPLTTDISVGKITAYLKDQPVAEMELKPEVAIERASIPDLLIRIYQKMLLLLTEGS